MSARDWLVLAGLAAAWIASYAIGCLWFPLRRCWCCKGVGRHFSDDRMHHRRCRWCAGSGGRIRLGRRVWSFARRHQRDARDHRRDAS
jgi:hypothetical protein